MRFEVEQASRGLSAIAELLVSFSDRTFCCRAGIFDPTLHAAQEFVSDVITQQTRLVDEALNGVYNGWNEAIEQLVSPSPRADTISSDQVNSLVKQFQPMPDIHQSVDNDSFFTL